MNSYSFLITILHELAHLFTFERYGNRVASHGKEWKNEFRNILSEFIQQKFFPEEIESALLQSQHNPAASSCADTHLMRVLNKYDIKKTIIFLWSNCPIMHYLPPATNGFFKKGQGYEQDINVLNLLQKNTIYLAPFMK